MGILNSRLLIFVYRLLAIESGRVLAQVKPTILAKLPIPSHDQANAKDQELHDRLTGHVKERLRLHQSQVDIQTPQEWKSLERQIATNEAQINDLVYKLYDLTEDEVRQVERELEPS
jgi:exonuclease VII large subunit